MLNCGYKILGILDGGATEDIRRNHSASFINLFVSSILSRDNFTKGSKNKRSECGKMRAELGWAAPCDTTDCGNKVPSVHDANPWIIELLNEFVDERGELSF